MNPIKLKEQIRILTREELEVIVGGIEVSSGAVGQLMAYPANLGQSNYTSGSGSSTQNTGN